MDKLKSIFDRIPWASFGRSTPISKLAESIVPIGNRPELPITDPEARISSTDPGFEDWIMEIQGTAFQVGRGKLLTCWHVCEALEVKERRAHIQANTSISGEPAKRYYPVAATFNFIDPRTQSANPNIDVGMVICPAVHSADFPYNVPVVNWGDSTKLGVGDRVLIGGFPLGRDLFLVGKTNRGIVQPTFYDGIISAILPATRPNETRMLQISSVALGGISGGVVCDAETGEVVGMVQSGLDEKDTRLPITYAIPSEILQPWSAAISFQTISGELWQ